MDAATGTLIGTAIGSAATLFTTYLTGFFTLNKERFTAQLALDKERQAAEFALQKEREARSAQETSAVRKWQREQLAASLTNAALVVNMYISMILGRTWEDYQKDPEVIMSSALENPKQTPSPKREARWEMPVPSETVQYPPPLWQWLGYEIEGGYLAFTIDVVAARQRNELLKLRIAPARIWTQHKVKMRASAVGDKVQTIDKAVELLASEVPAEALA